MIKQLREDINNLNNKFLKLETKLNKIINILEKPDHPIDILTETPKKNKYQYSPVLPDTPTPYSLKMQTQSPFTFNKTNFKDRQIQELLTINNELTE